MANNNDDDDDDARRDKVARRTPLIIESRRSLPGLSSLERRQPIYTRPGRLNMFRRRFRRHPIFVRARTHGLEAAKSQPDAESAPNRKASSYRST